MKKSFYTLSEVAMRFFGGVSETEAAERLHKAGILPIVASKRLAARPLYRVDEVDALIELDAQQHDSKAKTGKGVTEIAAELSLTPQTVRRRISHLRMLPCGYALRSRNRVAIYSKCQIARIRTYRAPRHLHVLLARRSEDEMTVKEIADLCGVSSARVAAVIGVLHLRPAGRYVRKSDCDEISTYYRADALTVLLRIESGIDVIRGGRDD